MEQRLGQRLEAADPHLGRREGVHPGHEADALRRGVGFEHRLPNGIRRGEHRLHDDADRNVGRGVESRGDLAAMFGDRAERLFAIQMLAAGQQPNLELLQVNLAHGNR